MDKINTNINQNMYSNNKLDVVKTSKESNDKEVNVDKKPDAIQDSVRLSSLALAMAKLNGIPQIREIKIKEALEKIENGDILEPPNLRNGILRMLTFISKK